MRNVVLLCLDSVRADTFREFAPRLRGRSGAIATQCRAASSWSVPSHASMLTGELPHEHGVHTHNRSYDRLSKSQTFLSELETHRHLGVSTNVFASAEFEFDALFDEFETISAVQPFPSGIDPTDYLAADRRTTAYKRFLTAAIRSDSPAKSLANGVLGALDSIASGRPVPQVLDGGTTGTIRQCRRSIDRTTEPFVLFTNLMEAHTPLANVVGYDDSLHSVPNTYSTAQLSVWDLIEDGEDHTSYLDHRRALYGASIDYLDRKLDAFVDWVDATTDRETTIVVTADHGENLGYEMEDGLVRHKSSLSEGVLHVPLCVINPPPGFAFGDERYVSQLSLGELLTNLAHGTCTDVTADRIPAELVGMSAGPEPPSRRSYWDRMSRCVYDGETKYVWDTRGETRKYRLDHSLPNWQRIETTAGQVPDWAGQFFDDGIVEAKRRATRTERESAEVSAGTASRLEQLGYM